MKRKGTTVIVIICLLVGVILAVLALRQFDASKNPPPAPTSTRVPTNTPQPTVAGQATAIFNGVNEVLSLTGAPTFAPGINSTEIIQTAVQATAVTATPTETRTPEPSATLRPTNVPPLGVGTQIFQRLQELQLAANDPTSSPGAPLEVFIDQSAKATATAIAATQAAGSS